MCIEEGRKKLQMTAEFIELNNFAGGEVKLTALEQQNGNLSQVEVDEVTGLVRYIRSKVASDDAMPGWVILFVEFLFNVSGNVLCGKR